MERIERDVHDFKVKIHKENKEWILTFCEKHEDLYQGDNSEHYEGKDFDKQHEEEHLGGNDDYGLSENLEKREISAEFDRRNNKRKAMVMLELVKRQVMLINSREQIIIESEASTEETEGISNTFNLNREEQTTLQKPPLRSLQFKDIITASQRRKPRARSCDPSMEERRKREETRESSPNKSMNSMSYEVEKTMELGKMVRFGMEGMEIEVKSIITEDGECMFK
ncbi:hypothetical protein L2E82_45043 [Cichorium intybus]|uniref:Uncharacterized protein n=1 Tax=Cichorium intybus TaxID=13427 RepID=A0ACB8ZRY1_CICIN|nr:hypothetical protein L2E82_45043 [Cichorium intybus]